MAKRRSASKRKRARRPAPRPRVLERRLRAVDRWIETGEHELALEELDKLLKRYPESLDLYHRRLLVLQRIGQYWEMAQVAQRMLALDPDTPDHYKVLWQAYSLVGCIALASRVIETFLQRWPDHTYAEEARGLRQALQEDLTQSAKNLELPLEEAFPVFELHERLQMALHGEDWEQVPALVEQIQERAPHFVAPLNNLALFYILQGQLDEAVAAEERALERDPQNINALSNLIHAFILAGRFSDAELTARRLRRAPVRQDRDWVKKLEGFVWLGDDQAVLDIFEEAQAEDGLDLLPPYALAYHYAAVAASRLGDQERARALWRQALDILPALSLAHDNLVDSYRSPGQREGAWPFTLLDWLPEPWLEALNKVAKPKRRITEEVARREIRNILQQYPQVIGLAPILLERGDRITRQFILAITVLSDHPALQAAARAFALGPWGSDELRMQAAEYCAQRGLLPRGQRVKMWQDGELKEVLMRGWKILSDPWEQLPRRIQRLYAHALDLVQEDRLEEAEALLRQGLELMPNHPAFLQSLVHIYGRRGEIDQAEKLARQAFESDPNQLLNRCNFAAILAYRGEVEEAKRLIQPLWEVDQLHFSEFAALCIAQMEILLKERKREEALEWVALIEEIDPTYPGLSALRSEIGEPTDLLRRFLSRSS